MLPAPDTLLPIAEVSKSYGIQGEIIISFRESVGLENDRPVFLLFEGLPVPFFITGIQRKGNRKAVMKLEGIDTLEDAEEITGKAVLIRPEDYGLEDEEDEESLVGFTLYDDKGRRIGIIDRIHDFSGNICLETEGSDILIPFHEDLLISISAENREIILNISEGLLP